MSTQSDYDNSVQTLTARTRRTLFMIAPIEAWAKRQEFDAAEAALRSSEQLADDLDAINEFWLTAVEEITGPFGAEAWDEIKAAYRRVHDDVVASVLRAKANELEAKLGHVDPNAQHRLSPRTQGIQTGRMPHG